MLNNLYDISNTMRPGDNFTFDFSDEFVCVLSKSLKHNDTSFPIKCALGNSNPLFYKASEISEISFSPLFFTFIL